MSHELRSPLNVILGFAEMARDPAISPAERERCLTRVEAAGRELLCLIESTLEVGKLEAGRDDVRIEPIVLRTFWPELGRSCEAFPHGPGVVLDWSGDVPDVTIATDPRKLTLIARNLVGNALKFTERGWVRADVRVRDDALLLRVADTGIGIRSDDQSTIFEMFRQADGSDSRRYGGTGLGLYIVRRFVEQLGGTIALDSTLGVGSTFVATVPVARIATAGQLTDPPEAAVGRAG
jgi:signal transduction histidine kinase